MGQAQGKLPHLCRGGEGAACPNLLLLVDVVAADGALRHAATSLRRMDERVALLGGQEACHSQDWGVEVQDAQRALEGGDVDGGVVGGHMRCELGEVLRPILAGVQATWQQGGEAVSGISVSV